MKLLSSQTDCQSKVYKGIFMDWRNRKYYCVSFCWSSIDMRIDILKTIGAVNIYPYKCIPKQTDEMEERGHYQYLLGVPSEYSEAVEYELRKAKRNDDWCKWKEIKRNISNTLN